MKKEYFTAIYCPPCPPFEGYPDRIIDEVYDLLAQAGIKHVYGYYEDKFGEDYLQRSLDLCAKNGLLFYPRLGVFDKYLGEQGNTSNPLHASLSEEQKMLIDHEMIKWLEKIKRHPGFGGIFFSDERPYETYEGMGYASKLFARLCPKKEFHYNALNYFPEDSTLFYRDGNDANRKLQLNGNLAFSVENRFHRFYAYIDEYLNQCETNNLSCDLYPFAPVWKNVPTSIHRGLYETNSVFATYKNKRGINAYICIQVGDWDNSFREIGRAETALHLNVTAAYGLDGFIFFPGVFPNDWLNSPHFSAAKNGDTGLLDVYGKPTKHYGYVKELISHLQMYAPILRNAEWLGVCTVGEFDGGFDGVDISKELDSECIYQGGLTESETHAYTGELPQIQTQSQLFIGVFKDENGEKIYLIVNNTLVRKTSFEVHGLNEWQCIANGEMLQGNGNLKFCLNAGESVLLRLKK